MPSAPSSPARPTPEILAPAGSWEAFLAGLDAGADAFYLGLQEGSARARARNFTLQDLGKLVPLAHEHGRRVYVTLNTLLKEEEAGRVAEVLGPLQELGVDALILQDLGLWRICREAFPGLALHGSTQMTVHNAAGVRQLAGMGFTRAILARECTLPEIRAMRQAADLPLEVFVHGALCYSVSGLCLASSSITGGSANRGWCSQSCRWRYVRNPEDTGFHPLSPSDLSLLEHVRDLAACGVASLKIEGRLKGPEYVRAVVRAYRRVLDAEEDEVAAVLGSAGKLLRGVPGRNATDGYALHPHPKEVLKKGADPTLGTLVGSVRKVQKNQVTVGSKQNLRRGDRLRIFSAHRGRSVAVTLRSVRREKTPGGTLFHITVGERVARGDRVYRVKEASAEEYVQELAKRAKALPAAPGLPLALEVTFGEEELQLRASLGALVVERGFRLTMHEAERRPLDYYTLEKHLGRLGGAGYRLASLKVHGQIPPVVIPPSAFKEVRRELGQALDAARAEQARGAAQRVQELRSGPTPPPKTEDKRLWLRTESVATARALLEQKFHRLVLAMNRDLLRSRDRLVQELQSRERLVWELPAWLPEGDVELYRERLATLAREGYREIAVTNLGHLELLAGLELTPLAGRELHCLNGWALAGLAELGCAAATISPESDAANLAAIAEQGWPLPALAITFGSLPLFTTRLNPGTVWNEEQPLRTGENVGLSWSAAPKALGQDWYRVYPDTPLCWSQHMAALRAQGVHEFLFDFGGRPFSRKELGILVKKFKTERPLKDSSDWNYLRGLK